MSGLTTATLRGELLAHCACEFMRRDVDMFETAIRTDAIASVLDVDRVAAALHAECVVEWDIIDTIDPTRQYTQHGPDAHRALALRVVAALTGGQG